MIAPASIGSRHQASAEPEEIGDCRRGSAVAAVAAHAFRSRDSQGLLAASRFQHVRTQTAEYPPMSWR